MILAPTRSHVSQHLQAKDIQESGWKCPICATPGARDPILRIQSNPDIFLLHCSHCMGDSVSHLPKQEFLSEYYAHYHDERTTKVTFGQPQRLARYIFRYLSQLSGDTVRILDFGGGDGSVGLELSKLFLSSNQAQQIDLFVADYQQPTPSQDPRIRVHHESSLTNLSGSADVVIASAVLEHIPELHRVLQQLFESIAPNGFFYARTPWIGPLKKIFPIVDFTYPAHVHDLSNDFWNRAIDVFGFRGHIVTSQPALIATSFRSEPFRTAAAFLMKLPARMEQLIFPSRQNRLWKLVGGWEAVLRKDLSS